MRVVWEAIGLARRSAEHDKLDLRMIGILLTIAVLNLCLGFAAALYTGRGPRCWADVSRAVEFRVVLDATPLTRKCNPLAWLKRRG